MPRYEIRRTSDSALTYVEGDTPLNLMLSQGAGTYRARVMSAEEATDIVVPTLTAGTIDQVTPNVGDTLTVSGSNAPAGSTYLWEVDTGSGFGAAGGTNNTASYNTTAQPAGDYRRQVTAGPQSATTASVTVSGSAFSPDDLFASGERGMWFTPTAANVYSDAGVTLAAVGDDVQQANANGNFSASSTLSQATASARPTLRQDGSTYYLELDGNDVLITDSAFSLADATNGYTLFARIRPSTNNSGNFWSSDGNTARIVQFRTNASNSVEMISFTGVGSNNISPEGGTVSTGTWNTVCGIMNPTNARVWANTMTDAAVLETVANSDGSVPTFAQAMRLGNRDGLSTAFFTGDVSFVFCINRSLTEAERIDLNTYVNGL